MEKHWYLNTVASPYVKFRFTQKTLIVNSIVNNVHTVYCISINIQKWHFSYRVQELFLKMFYMPLIFYAFLLYIYYESLLYVL